MSKEEAGAPFLEWRAGAAADTMEAVDPEGGVWLVAPLVGRQGRHGYQATLDSAHQLDRPTCEEALEAADTRARSRCESIATRREQVAAELAAVEEQLGAHIDPAARLAAIATEQARERQKLEQAQERARRKLGALKHEAILLQRHETERGRKLAALRDRRTKLSCELDRLTPALQV